MEIVRLRGVQSKYRRIILCKRKMVYDRYDTCTCVSLANWVVY